MITRRFSKAITFFVLLSFMLVSCTSATKVVPTNPASQNNTVAPSVTLPPTDTPTPTITPSPTPIPGPWYGVPITTENANQIRQLAIWGKGLLWTWRETYSPGYYNPALIKLGLGNQWTFWATDYAIHDKIFIVQTTRGIYLYAVDSGEEIAAIDNVITYIISDDGDLIATGHNDGKVRLWNAADGTLLAEFQYKLTKEKDPLTAGGSLMPMVSALAISHSGKLVAAGYADEYIIVWTQGNPSPKLTIYTNPAPPNYWIGIRALAFSPDDKFLYGSFRGGASLWKTSDGKQVLGFDNLVWEIPRPAFSPDGKFLASSLFHTFYLQDTSTGKTIIKADLWGTLDTGVPDVKFSVSADWQYLIVDYMLENKRELRSLPEAKLIETMPRPAEIPVSLFDSGHLWGLRGAKALPDKSLLVWGATNDFIFWWKPSENQFKKYSQAYPKVFFSPTGKYAAGCQNGIEIFTIEGVFQNIPLEGYYTCGGIIFSPDEDMLAVWTKNRLAIVTISTGETQNITAYQKPIMTATFSSDGKFLATIAASRPFEILIWETKPLTKHSQIVDSVDTYFSTYYESYSGHRYFVFEFSPDSKVLAARGYGNPLRLWNVSDGSLIGTVNVSADTIAFSPDQKILATSNRVGIISLWQIPDGNKLSELRGHVHLFEQMTKVNGLSVLNFPPDGLDFLSIENEKYASAIPNLSISSLSFLPDGTGIISVGADGTIRLWGINPNLQITSTAIPATSTPKYSWNFDQDGNLEGWGVQDWQTVDLSSLEVKGGYLTAKATGVDPQIYSTEGLGIDAAKFSKIEIRMRVSAGKSAQVYFSFGNGDWSESKSKEFETEPGNEFKTYVIDLRDVSSWKGIVNQLRLDPTSDSIGASIEIDYIRLLP